MKLSGGSLGVYRLHRLIGRRKKAFSRRGMGEEWGGGARAWSLEVSRVPLPGFNFFSGDKNNVSILLCLIKYALVRI